MSLLSNRQGNAMKVDVNGKTQDEERSNKH